MTGATTKGFDERTSDAAEDLCTAHLQVAAIVAGLDLDDAGMWVAANAVVAEKAGESYRTTAVLSDAPSRSPRLIDRVRELATAQRCLLSTLDTHADRGGQLADTVLGSAARRRLLGRLRDLNDAPQRRRPLGSRGKGWA
jgi:hypothetical protein